MPRNNNNNTIVVTQSARVPSCLSGANSPDHHILLIREYNNGRNSYTVHLFLESDPAVLQALLGFRIVVSGYRTQTIIANKFVSLKVLCIIPCSL